MLSIRMQRTGRKGHALYRVVVQDSRQSPTSGKFVARLGHYDPHTKTAVIDKEKATTFMTNGAQPSDRVVSLFKAEKIDLPKWVREPAKKERSIRNPEKLRRNQPKEEAVVEEPAVEATTEPTTTETPAPEAEKEPEATEVAEEKPAEEAKADESAPADDKKNEAKA